MNSFDIAAFFGNKFERCFDIVASVDGTLRRFRERYPQNISELDVYR